MDATLTNPADFRPLTLSDVEPAASIIAQAFLNDPFIAFMLPIKAGRIQTLVKFFRIYGEINIKNGRGYGTGDPLQGVAYWKTPEQASLSISLKSLGKFLPLLFTLYPIGYIRARTVFEHTENLHQKYAPEPHFYLDNLGVLPSAQGKGWSSKLIRPILALADQQKATTYTETTARGNVGLYEHFGFQCVQEKPVPGTGVTIFALLRPVK